MNTLTTVKLCNDPLIKNKHKYYDIKYIKAIKTKLIRLQNEKKDKNYVI